MPPRDVATNRQASYRYHLLEKWERGLVLQGTEVKALRDGKAQIKDGYAAVKDGEVWLYNVHIPPYGPASRENHEPERPRKRLMHRREMERRVGGANRQAPLKGPRSVPPPPVLRQRPRQGGDRARPRQGRRRQAPDDQ